MLPCGPCFHSSTCVVVFYGDKARHQVEVPAVPAHLDASAPDKHPPPGTTRWLPAAPSISLCVPLKQNTSDRSRFLC